MSAPKISTLKELKASQYKPTSIKQELRRNLIKSIKAKGNPFDGIWGYENTVIPQIERAILSKHNIILLGLRGQAKTKIARLMVNLLDEWMPVVSGSEINDDPLNPISRYAFDKIAEHGLETPISWVHRSDRYYEKLATPDVTIADLIGDIDPIKAANMRLSYADDRVIHFGMIPRANRSIFVINELPDLQPRIQVALFNILQEGDMQIRGFKLRLNPDLQFLFTALKLPFLPIYNDSQFKVKTKLNEKNEMLLAQLLALPREANVLGLIDTFFHLELLLQSDLQ